jgi:hypothetical protein
MAAIGWTALALAFVLVVADMTREWLGGRR